MQEGDAVALKLGMPDSGNRTSGNKAVIAIGPASVATHTAINIPPAAVVQPCSVSPSGVSVASINNARKGPRNRPTV